jgi:hypothetical protein
MKPDDPYNPVVTESAILVKGAARWLEPYGYRAPKDLSASARTMR